MTTNNAINYQIGAPNGVATLDSGGHLTSTQFPALTGDISTTAGSLTTTLPNIVAAATNPKITYNAKGQITSGAALSKTDIPNIDESQVTNLVTDLANKQPLNSILTNLSALGTLGILVQTALGGVAARSIGSSDSSVTISNGDAVLGNVDIILNLTSIKWKPITESTTARTLSLTDVNITISTTNASADTTIMVPANATAAIPIGAQFKVINASAAGFVTNIVAAGGVTFLPFTSVVIGLGGFALLEKTGTNTWLILQCYEQYSFSTTWSGIWASPQTGNCNITRNMNNLSITVPTVVSTQNTSNHISSVASLPARFCPTANTEISVPSINNGGNNTAGNGTVASFGQIVIYTASYGNFSGTGAGGFNRQNFSYTLI